MRRLVATLLAAGGLIGLPAAAQTPAVPVPDDWGQALREDARAFHDLIAQNHPGPVDPQNPGFAPLLEEGLRTALARAETATAYEDWYFALQAFSASFNDGHLGLTQYARMDHEWRRRWPGFTTALRGDHAEVVFSPNADGPPVGARLVDCDGRDAEAVAAELLGQGAGRWSLRSRRAALSPSLFIDHHDPYVSLPQTCRFAVGDEVRGWSLDWIPMSDAEEEAAYAAAASDRFFTGVGLRRFEGGYWIELGSFDPAATSEEGVQLVAARDAVAAEAEAIREAGVVVFDLRGNNGGSSSWSEQIASSLWGEAWIAARRQGSDAVDWRVSPDNLETVASYEGLFADNPEIVAFVQRIVAGMTEAQARGEALWRESLFEPQSEEATAEPEVPSEPLMRGRAYVLTDFGCASACLDAVDILTAAGAVVIGQETSGDTVYMETRSEPLPSGRVRAYLPMKVYRGRPRGNNETVVPAHAWTGEMSDTAGLEAWVMQLAGAAETP